MLRHNKNYLLSYTYKVKSQTMHATEEKSKHVHGIESSADQRFFSKHWVPGHPHGKVALFDFEPVGLAWGIKQHVKQFRTHKNISRMEIYCKQAVCSSKSGSTREISNSRSVTATVVSDLNVPSETELSTSWWPRHKQSALTPSLTWFKILTERCDVVNQKFYQQLMFLV